MKFLSAFSSLAVAAFACAVAVVAFSAPAGPLSRDRVPSIAGYRVFTVLSGSMEPALRTGGLIIVRVLAPDEPVTTGDIITFRTGSEDSTLVTHRVVQVTQSGGTAAYITKGDANNTPDPLPVERERIIGRVQLAVPYAGYLAHFAKEPRGFVLIIAVPVALIAALQWRHCHRGSQSRVGINFSRPRTPAAHGGGLQANSAVRRGDPH